MNDLIIIGSGGFGREVAWLTERINATSPTWNILGFIDDDLNKKGKTVGRYSVLGCCEDAKKFPNAYFVCAVGSARAKAKIVERLINLNKETRFATLVDPSVILSERVTIGEGSIICAGSILTVDIEIGNHVVINLDCTIGHDAVIKDFVTIYPSVNVSGMTCVNSCAELGTGTQIIQGKSIGTGTIVGAGAVVVKDIPDNCTAVGSPAKPIKFHLESES